MMSARDVPRRTAPVIWPGGAAGADDLVGKHVREGDVTVAYVDPRRHDLGDDVRVAAVVALACELAELAADGARVREAGDRFGTQCGPLAVM